MSYITVVQPVSAFCGKTFKLDDKGQVEKSRAMAPAKSVAYTVPCNSLHHLSNIINALEPGMAIILGYVEETVGGERFHLWSKKSLTEKFFNGDQTISAVEPHELIIRHNSELYLPRLKALFKPAPYFCLDRDIDDDAPEAIAAIQSMSNAQYLDVFRKDMGEEIAQAFTDVAYLAVESSTGQVYREDGRPYKTDVASHLFFQVQDADDIERFSMALAAQTIANGYAYLSEIKHKNGGVAARKKMIFDPSVFTAGRLFFESSPRSLSPKLVVKKNPCEVTNNPLPHVNTLAVRDPNTATLMSLERQDISFKGNHFQTEGLTEFLPVETEEFGVITVGHYRDNIAKKVRCQTPFRESSSWAAYLNRHDDGSVYLWDEGTRTKYTMLPDTEALEKMHKAALSFVKQSVEMNTLAKECLAISEQEEERVDQVLADTIDEAEMAVLLAEQAKKLDEKEQEEANKPPADQVPVAAQPLVKDEIEAFGAQELISMDLRSPEEMTLWGKFAMILGGLTVVGGAPKVGKSTLMLKMLMAAACGAEFLGHHFTKPYRVLWIQAEIKPEFLKQRILETLGTFTEEQQGLILKNFTATRDCDLELNGYDRMRYVALLHKYKPEMVAIDPIRNLVLLKNENDATEMKKAFSTIKATAHEVNRDISLVCSHHTRKDSAVLEGKGNTSPHDLYAGSGSLRGFYDFGIMMLNDPQQTHTKHLHFETRNGPSMDSISIRREGVEFLLGSGIENAVNQFCDVATADKPALVVGLVIEYLKAGKHDCRDKAGNWAYIREQVQNRLRNDFNLGDVKDRTIKDYCERNAAIHFFKAGGNKFKVYYAS